MYSAGIKLRNSVKYHRIPLKTKFHKIRFPPELIFDGIMYNCTGAGKVGIGTDVSEESLTVQGNLQVAGEILHPSDRNISFNTYTDR